MFNQANHSKYYKFIILGTENDVSFRSLTTLFWFAQFLTEARRLKSFDGPVPLVFTYEIIPFNTICN